MPSDEQLDTIVSAIKGGTLDPKTLPPEKRQRLKDALTDYQTRKTSKAQDYGEALLTNKPTQGIGQELVRGAPRTVGMMAGAAAAAPYGAAVGAPFGPVGMAVGGGLAAIGGAALGSTAMESARQAVAQGTAAAFPEANYPIQRPGQLMNALGGAAKEGAMAEATGQVAGPVLNASKKVIKPILGFFGNKLGGLSDFTIKSLEENAPLVMKYARMGADKAKEAAAQHAKDFGTLIDRQAEKAGELYREILVKTIGDTKRYDLSRELRGAIEAVRKDFGYDILPPKPMTGHGIPVDPALAPRKILGPTGDVVSTVKPDLPDVGSKIERVSHPDEVASFNEFAALAGRSKDVSAEQVYYFQRDLSNAIKRNAGKPIAAALAQLKKSVMPLLPTMGGANVIYRGAMELSEELSRVVNADDKARAINSAFRNKGETRDAILSLISKDKAAKASVDGVLAATAGSQASRYFRDLPHTGLAAGYGAAAGAGAHLVGANPLVGVPVAALGVAASSPRAYGGMYNIMSKDWGLNRGASMAAVQALRAQREK